MDEEQTLHFQEQLVEFLAEEVPPHLVNGLRVQLYTSPEAFSLVVTANSND